jgi:hypothetical protein
MREKHRQKMTRVIRQRVRKEDSARERKRKGKNTKN